MVDGGAEKSGENDDGEFALWVCLGAVSSTASCPVKSKRSDESIGGYFLESNVRDMHRSERVKNLVKIWMTGRDDGEGRRRNPSFKINVCM